MLFEGNRALVRGDRQQLSITINIQGPAQSRRRLLAIIRSDFDRIHRSFKFIPNEQVPVPGHPTVTVGYKEFWGYIDGQISLDEAVELVKRNSRRYAKRQLTWLRRNKELIWVRPDEEDKMRTIIQERTGLAAN